MESATLPASPATTAAFYAPPATYLYNITAGAINVTSNYLRTSSARELSQFPLRLASHVDRAVFRTFPRFILQAVGLQTWSNAAGNTATNTIATNAGAIAGNMANVAGENAARVAGETASGGWTTLFAEVFQSSTFKSYWGMIHYLTSRWAFACFTMALILNRINVYGAARQRIFLTWNKRLALRVIPILLLIPQIHHLLQGIRCQTSPDYSYFRHGDNNKYSLLDWSTDGGSLHTLSSKVLFLSTDEEACAAIGMSRPSPDVRAKYGSFSLLWPTFLRLSASHIVESLSCSLQQHTLMTEVGMSIFEHSLAFAEAETMITHALGIGMFSNPRAAKNTTSSTQSPEPTHQATIPASGTILALSDAVNALKGPHLLDRVNVPVEVLLVSLLSCGNALTSHIISILGKQRQWRLVNTGLWGMCFMAAFIWGFSTTSIMVRSSDDGDNRPVSSLLHFPTVAIVGFLPHMLILLGIGICIIIYAVALLLTAVSLGTNPNIPRPNTLKQRFVIAHDNLQAAIQLRGISIKWYEDFYTALLRVGFAALTAASEAVFLNEGRAVEMRQFTWLEEERLDEIQALRKARGDSLENAHFQIVEEYGLPPSSPGGSDKGGVWESGFAKERKFDKKEGEVESKDSFVYPTPRSGGIGAVQRTTRFYLLFIYLRGIMFLVAGWITFGFGKLLDQVGVTSRPRWLRRIVGRSLKRMAHDRNRMRTNRDVLDFWLLTKDGKLAVPRTDDLDIEPEMRKRVLLDHEGDEVEKVLDSKMYDWWKAGGWFGMKDESGDYQPPSQDELDDITSVVSMSTNASMSQDGEDDNAWESESDGQHTPTQIRPRPLWSFSELESRESTPEVDNLLDAQTLARLLNPPDKATQEEARVLAAHLTSSTSGQIMTRSRFRKEIENERARILLAGRMPRATQMPHISLYNNNNTTPLTPPVASQSRPLTNAEEAEVLEQLILSRRKDVHRPDTNDLGDDDDSHQPRGPPCVVCHTSPRTIIAWPCRCLCVCEDCRVSLALNNFGNCITCRRTVGGFVRLYVP